MKTAFFPKLKSFGKKKLNSALASVKTHENGYGYNDF